jgi:diguanylate cyclase (GGDEF)-like protein
MKMRVPRSAALGCAATLVVLAAIGDRITGDDVAFTLVYLVPVAIATWWTGRTSGLIAAVAAGACSLWANRNHFPPLSHAVQFWNAATEAAVLTATAMLLAALNRQLKLESETARTDLLTGLKNRRAFDEAGLAEIDRASRHGRPLTVAILDLDGLKQVNDTLGHKAGDEALVTVADVLRQRLRAIDVVARLGGDEFGVMLPETGALEAATLFDDLLKQVPTITRDRGCPVGLSLGAVTFTTVPENIGDAIREADALLYEAKRAGKGRSRHVSWPSEPEPAAGT